MFMGMKALRKSVSVAEVIILCINREILWLAFTPYSKTVADLKAKFPILQDGIKGVISTEMERAICNEK